MSFWNWLDAKLKGSKNPAYLRKMHVMPLGALLGM
jgi:hypothetical protein